MGDDIARLRTTPRYPSPAATDRIHGEDSSQADLYAAAFVRRLLSQNYRAPRAGFLAWVQAESAQSAEPLVVGLVPQELRDRLAVYSVTDNSGGPSPVPSEQEWQRLASRGATTTVTIDRVDEPAAWSAAVDAGRIHDPGATARQVLATVTQHIGAASTRYSVAATVNLEGPPVRGTWGFVDLLTYTSIPTSTS